ncbi:MAG: SPOR domain-containing protein, partial [Verrucomicrobiota bacterium]
STLVRRPTLTARKIQPLRPHEGQILVRMEPVSAFLARIEAPPRDLIPVSAAAADLASEEVSEETSEEPQVAAEPTEVTEPAGPTEPTEPAAAGDYRLQFGAFAKEQNAAGLTAELNSKGVATEVIKRPGQVLYKVVSMKRFETTVSATKHGEKLVQDLGIDQTVVTR